ncbi:MAG: hypothetical protein IMY83_01690 [Chloroflexi bacterium]|nr:hypothetical protein [Chloroflexota bacterium]
MRGVPFVGWEPTRWAIGIYTGDSPLSLSPSGTKNPVLTAADVADAPATFVADPFMLYENDTWYMFLEVMNAATNQGDIAFATSDDGLNWTYEQIVLDEPFHLTYPYVFKWQDEYYMVPESHEVDSIRLYRAVDFPTEWSFVGTLLEGSGYVDSAVFHFNSMWWLFTSFGGSDTLHLYCADELLGPWIEHPESPIIEGDANIARPGGRVLVFDGRIIRYTQDDEPTYGNQVRAFEITELTTTSYEEKEVSQNPILEPSGTGWNARGMHHIDPHQVDEGKWIACVDGYGDRLVFGLKY